MQRAFTSWDAAAMKTLVIATAAHVITTASENSLSSKMNILFLILFTGKLQRRNKFRCNKTNSRARDNKIIDHVEFSICPVLCI